MSWLSNLVHAVVNGVEGKGTPPIVNNPSSPLAAPVDALGKAINGLAQAASELAANTVESYLSQHVGAAGNEVADMALESLISYATSKLSTTPAPAAQATS